jgi:hypothetical protein
VGELETPSHCLAKIQDKTKIITLEQKKKEKKKGLKGHIVSLKSDNPFVY